ELAWRGIHVVLTAPNPEGGRAAAETLVAEHLPVEFQQLDVTDAASIGRLREFLDRKFDRLDILINNAAIVLMDKGGDVLSISVDRVGERRETNCYGPLQFSQVMIPLLRKSPRPRLINVSSTAGSITHMGPDWAAYRMSKTYLNAITAAIA